MINSAVRTSNAKNGAADPAAADAGGGATSNLRNYFLLVLERKWYAIAVLVLCVGAAAAYSLLSTRIYEGVAIVQVLKHGPQVMRVVDVVENSITSDTDFNTQIKVLESITIVKSVASRLTPDELKQLTAPFKNSAGDSASPVDIIYSSRRIQPQRLSLIVAIRFTHPDPKMAARIANLIASEYIAYNTRLRVEESMKAVDELKDRADQQRKRVDEISSALQAFRQRGNLISLIQSKDIVTEKLKALNTAATQTGMRLKEAEVRWNQVQEWTKSGRDLSELAFISQQPKVAQLSQQITTQKLALEQLRQRYKSKHPTWIEAANGLAQAEIELKKAIDEAAAAIKADYATAQQNDIEAHKALADQETKSLELDKSALEYDGLDRDFRVNEQLLESMMSRMRETAVTSSIEMESARIVDQAFEPGAPISPKLMSNLAMGLLAGIFLGSLLANVIATIDDRVKTTFDVETMVGLPLIGVIPRVERMDQPDKAQIVANGADRMIVESFLSLYSAIHLHEDGKNARLIMVTSSLPGEGKSFVSTNLALAFAAQGQKTVIVDCDLRKPNVQRSFRLRSSKGVTGYCLHGASLEEILVRDVHQNLDVITSGARAANPIQLFNSKQFELLALDLGRRYDRVIFDTPPLGVVSDALNILPLMDGALFAIRFNGVKRTTAQRCAKSLLATNIPIFGAVLNDMDTGVTGGYYVETNTKLFREYYDVEPENRIAGPQKTRGLAQRAS